MLFKSKKEPLHKNVSDDLVQKDMNKDQDRDPDPISVSVNLIRDQDLQTCLLLEKLTDCGALHLVLGDI